MSQFCNYVAEYIQSVPIRNNTTMAYAVILIMLFWLFPLTDQL